MQKIFLFSFIFCLLSSFLSTGCSSYPETREYADYSNYRNGYTASQEYYGASDDADYYDESLSEPIAPAPPASVMKSRVERAGDKSRSCSERAECIAHAMLCLEQVNGLVD